MGKRKPFLLRIDEEVLEELKKWADDELRSLNGQIEFLLRRALRERRRGGRRTAEGGPGETGAAGKEE